MRAADGPAGDGAEALQADKIIVSDSRTTFFFELRIMSNPPTEWTFNTFWRVAQARVDDGVEIRHHFTKKR
jgi:hypothetical protein